MGCICFSIKDFPLVLQAFWLSLGVLSVTALIVIAGVRLLQNHCFCIGFTSMFALTVVAVCDRAHRECWGAFASKSMLFYWFYEYFGSHWDAVCDRAHRECCGAFASKSMFFHLFHKHRF
jgi:hypothetical protein